MRVLIFLFLMFVLNNANALSIQHVSHSPASLSYGSGEGVNVRFNLDQQAAVTLNIYDDREYLIRAITSATMLKKGDNKLHWDGKDMSGNYVPAEAYHYTITATDSDSAAVYDITDLFTSNKNTIRDINWDRENGTISYMLTKPSRVNIRAGLANGGPLLETVINWLPRKRGKNVEKWDGYDKNKKFNIAKLPRAKVFTETYSFPANTIIVGFNKTSVSYIDESKLNETRIRAPKKTQVLFDQAGKTAKNRSDYKLLIGLPDTKNHRNGIPVYKSNIQIKISVPKSDMQRMSRDRYEPILFLDGEFVSEIESGFLPISWNLDITDLEAGEHFITVNVRGYDGQYGAISRSIYIEK